MSQGGYLHRHHESVLRSHRWRTAENSAGYLLAHLRRGQSVLDIGCKPGTITVDIAARVAPGQVTAVDVSEEVLESARAEARARGLSNVSFTAADVHALESSDAAFDVVHAHQVLQHVADPVQALREMRRVCVPGGLVAARDADYAGFIWFPQLPPLDRWRDLYQRAAQANHGEPNAGRQLLSWAQQAGFQHIRPTASVWCFATPEDRDWWGAMWADRILRSSVARQLLDAGLASPNELAEISEAWRAWAAAPDVGWPFRMARSSAGLDRAYRRPVSGIGILFYCKYVISNDNDTSTSEEPCVWE